MIRRVIDDFLPEEKYKNLEYLILGSDINWKLHNGTVGNPTSWGDWRFTHVVYHQRAALNTKHKPDFFPVFEHLDIKALISCKLNCDVYTVEPEQRPWHTDQLIHADCTFTSILYFNDCNGKTIFEDGFSVESKRNRMLIFNSEQKHAGVTQTNTPRRYLLNTNFFGDPNKWKN
tara:strand:+ start:135 stop:656 length:522 start_codon:yes stop_codon:yes gene_type:complete